MSFIEDDDLVQAFRSNRSHLPFSKRIRIRRLARNVNYLHPWASDGEVIYFNMPQWGPHNVRLMRARLVANE